MCCEWDLTWGRRLWSSLWWTASTMCCSRSTPSITRTSRQRSPQWSTMLVTFSPCGIVFIVSVCCVSVSVSVVVSEYYDDCAYCSPGPIAVSCSHWLWRCEHRHCTGSAIRSGTHHHHITSHHHPRDCDCDCCWQEVIACTAAVERYASETDVAIELGGEDAKITYFGESLEQRMNGTCAGGTGSFIDHMAVLLQVALSSSCHLFISSSLHLFLFSPLLTSFDLINLPKFPVFFHFVTFWIFFVFCFVFFICTSSKMNQSNKWTN